MTNSGNGKDVEKASKTGTTPALTTVGLYRNGVFQKAAAFSDTVRDASKDAIYLPPSFMEATLLSGLDAPVLKEAKSNPVPVLLRIKDLAVLPNRLKADLKGCFVIAEGHGDQPREQRRHGGQQQGVARPAPQQGRDRYAVREGVAEIAGEHGAEPAQVADDEGVVEAIARPQGVHRF